MMVALEYFVGGVAKPQGSKKAMRAKNSGKIITKEASDTLAVWRNDVAVATGEVMRDKGLLYPMSGLVALDVRFYFRAPKPLTRQYRTTFAKGGDAAVAQRWSELYSTWDKGSLHKHYGDDLDKLVRAVGDALSAGGAIADDRQIAWLTAGKFFALYGGQRSRAGAKIALIVKPTA